MTSKVWLLRFVPGNPALFSKVVTGADSPYTRAAALADAAKVTSNGGWRVWVEHAKTGQRIFESDAEKQFQAEHPPLAAMPRSKPTKLTTPQARVLKWLQGGWAAQKANGSAIHVNGRRICNIDTITTLVRLGLVEADGQYCFKATSSGANFNLSNYNVS